MGNNRDDNRNPPDPKDEPGKHEKEDYTRDGRPDPARPLPPPPDPNKHDR